MSKAQRAGWVAALVVAVPTGLWTPARASKKSNSIVAKLNEIHSKIGQAAVHIKESSKRAAEYCELPVVPYRVEKVKTQDDRSVILDVIAPDHTKYTVDSAWLDLSSEVRGLIESLEATMRSAAVFK